MMSIEENFLRWFKERFSRDYVELKEDGDNNIVIIRESYFAGAFGYGSEREELKDEVKEIQWVTK